MEQREWAFQVLVCALAFILALRLQFSVALSFSLSVVSLLLLRFVRIFCEPIALPILFAVAITFLFVVEIEEQVEVAQSITISAAIAQKFSTQPH